MNTLPYVVSLYGCETTAKIKKRPLSKQGTIASRQVTTIVTALFCSLKIKNARYPTRVKRAPSPSA
jgi:hypothetical protein